MNDERIDLTLLDPTRDQAHFDRVVAAITDAAGPALARRQSRMTAIGQVAGWRRPMLAAAALIAIASVGVLTQIRTTAAEPTESEIALALGVPSGLAGWVSGEEVLSTAELLSALEEADQ